LFIRYDREFAIRIGVEMHMTTLQVSAQTYIQSHLHQVSFFSFIYLFDLNFLIFPPQLTRQEEQSLSNEKYGE